MCGRACAATQLERAAPVGLPHAVILCLVENSALDVRAALLEAQSQRFYIRFTTECGVAPWAVEWRAALHHDV